MVRCDQPWKRFVKVGCRVSPCFVPVFHLPVIRKIERKFSKENEFLSGSRVKEKWKCGSNSDEIQHVEFATDLRAQGKSMVEAIIEAARLRLHAIVMTSRAFTLGVLPLAISSGAGSGAQNAIGISVLGGMIAATVLGIFFVPVFFVMVAKLAPAAKIS
ncbi:hypothetical protein G3A39_42490 [Paraburkholderia aspalathi]|nr:hypothetical protein [Paraburkholderia aspalathi]